MQLTDGQSEYILLFPRAGVSRGLSAWDISKDLHSFTQLYGMLNSSHLADSMSSWSVPPSRYRPTQAIQSTTTCLQIPT